MEVASVLHKLPHALSKHLDVDEVDGGDVLAWKKNEDIIEGRYIIFDSCTSVPEFHNYESNYP